MRSIGAADRGNWKYWKNLSHCHTVHHTGHINWPGLEAGLPHSDPHRQGHQKLKPAAEEDYQGTTERARSGSLVSM